MIFEVISDNRLCDGIIQAKVQLEKDIALLLENCDVYEIRVVKDIAEATKSTLQKDVHLQTLLHKWNYTKISLQALLHM